MNKQSLFFTGLVAIIATALMLLVLQYIVKRKNIRENNEEQVLSISYSIWFVSFLIPFFLYLKISLIVLENYIEILINPKCLEDAFLGVAKRISILIGFTFLFTFAIYYIVNNISKITLGNRKDKIEIENNNKGYFVIKGVLMIFISFLTLTVFEHLLLLFSPVIDLPFYY